MIPRSSASFQFDCGALVQLVCLFVRLAEAEAEAEAKEEKKEKERKVLNLLLYSSKRRLARRIQWSPLGVVALAACAAR